jgi:hypothetical protein
MSSLAMNSVEFSSGAHVHAHPFEGFGLLFQGFIHLLVGGSDHSAESASEEMLLAVRSPCLGNGCSASAHVVFEVLVFDFLDEVGGEVHFACLVDKGNVAETELQHNVVVILEHVLDCKEDGLKDTLNNVFAHLAGVSNGNGVAVDGAETFLEDGALGLGRGDLFLSVVPNGQCLQITVDYEARL